MKIRTMLLLLSATFVVLIAAIGFMIFQTFDQINTKVARCRDANVVIKDISELHIVADEYLIYNERRMRQQWRLKYNSLGKTLRTMERKCLRPKENYLIHKRLQKDYKAIGSLFLQLQDTRANRKKLIKENRPISEINIALALERRLTAQSLMSSQRITSEAFKLSAVIQQTIVQAQHKANLLILFSIIGFAVCSSCISFLIIKSITRPINELIKGAGIIGKGDLEHKIVVRNKNEIRQLANSFNKMTEGLKEITVSRDELTAEVAERKKTEEKLEDANTHLFRTIEELKRTQQRVIAYERFNALGQMAGGVAHDFNNALVPILGYSDLLLSDPDMLDNRKHAIEILETIRTSAIEASRVVSRLSEFYRPSDEAERGPVDMSKLINNVLVLTRPRWKEEMEAKGISIEMKTEIRDASPVNANESQLTEVLINLIFNSVDAMPDGGAITIRSYTHGPGMGVVIETIDTGSGMTEEVRRLCMEPFFTTKEGRGSGLGLSIVHGIIQRHNGSVEIQSTPRKGTTVIIHLPGGKPSVKKEEPVSTAGVEAVQPMRVLFIDDELSARDLIADYLKADKHMVELAENGKEGLKKFRKRTFDLVIVDRAMPQMSGDRVAKAIKEYNPEMPVILLTGFGKIMIDKGETPPAVDMIVGKPITREGLARAMAKVMSDKTT